MSDWRENESEAWKAAYLTFAKEIGQVGANVQLTMHATMFRAYAVEAIMEFQKIMREKLGKATKED